MIIHNIMWVGTNLQMSCETVDRVSSCRRLSWRNSCRCRRPRVRCLSAWASWTPFGTPGWISCRSRGWQSCSCTPATWWVWTSGRRASSPCSVWCRSRPGCCTWKTEPSRTGKRLKPKTRRVLYVRQSGRVCRFHKNKGVKIASSYDGCLGKEPVIRIKICRSD